MDLGVRGKSAIVTGGSRGIGLAIANAFAREGMNVLLASRDRDVLAAAAQAIAREHGVRATSYAADLADPAEAAPCVEAALAAFGALDVLVNCAGATKRGDVFEVTDADWSAGYALKFHGAVRMCREAWPHLEARGGSVINIVGIASKTPARDFAIGGSVNAALNHFTKSLADIGRDRRVRVNSINPGYIATERLDRRIETTIAATGRSRETVVSDLLTSLAVRRFGTSDEIGNLAAYLVSDLSDYIHGAIIDIDGGVTRGF